MTAESEVPSALERLKTARSSLTSGGQLLQLRRSIDGAGLAGLVGTSKESGAGQVAIEARAGGAVYRTEATAAATAAGAIAPPVATPNQ